MSDDDLGLTPPQDITAEQAVLGSMMLSLEAVREVPEILTGRDFYQPAHESIFAAVLAVARKGGRPDSVTVADELADGLALAGGRSYLQTCISSVATFTNAGYYAEIVVEKATRRRLIEAGTRIVQAGYSTGGDAMELVDTARKEVGRVAVEKRSTVTLGEVADNLVNRFGSEQTRSIPTPWPELDALIGGLAPGRLYTVAGRPGMGKSVVGCGLALSTAQRGAHAFIASAEMDRDELAARIVASICEVDHERIYKGTVNDLEEKRIRRAWQLIQELPLHIEDGSQITVADVRAGARHVSGKGPLGVVVVDYIGLLKPATRRKSERDVNRQQEVAEMSRDLKILAREFRVPVVMLAQLNRQVESRADKRPAISDLRESGSLEQDSDVVILLHRDQDASPFEIALGVGKNRHGRIGRADLVFNGPYQRIESPQFARRAAS